MHTVDTANNANISILVAINDSMCSRNALNFLGKLPFRLDKPRITLLHVFRKPSGGEELMGEKFMKELPDRYLAVLRNARDKLVSDGFDPEKIEIRLVKEPYQTVAEGIIDQFKKGSYDMVVSGRKKMSKSEEFVLGDPGIKLVRALEGASILIVTES